MKMSARYWPDLTQSDLACEIHFTQPVNSHLSFKHSFNVALSPDAVNWSDVVNWSRFYSPNCVEIGSTQRSHNLPMEQGQRLLYNKPHHNASKR